MKPSVEKSLQMLWSRLTDLARYAYETPTVILQKRKETERKLKYFLKKYRTDLDLDIYYIKDVIYDENGLESLHEIIFLFKEVRDLDELNTIQGVINDAWNYFPHRSLGGLSPHEIHMESLN